MTPILLHSISRSPYWFQAPLGWFQALLGAQIKIKWEKVGKGGKRWEKVGKDGKNLLIFRSTFPPFPTFHPPLFIVLDVNSVPAPARGSPILEFMDFMGSLL